MIIETYITYKWGGRSELIVDEICPILDAVPSIRVFRDKQILGYRQSIEGFMEQLRHGEIVVMVLSDEYLKSLNCMYEMSGLFGPNFDKEKVFPVMCTTSIRNRNQYLEICGYWQKKQSELRTLIQKAHNEPSIVEPFDKDLLKIDKILISLPYLYEYCRDANVPDVEVMRNNGYLELVHAITERVEVLQGNLRTNDAPIPIRILIELNALSEQLLEKLAKKYKVDISNVETKHFDGQSQSTNPTFAIEDSPMVVYLLLQELQNVIKKEDIKGIHYTSLTHRTERDLKTISKTLNIIRHE